MKKIFLQFLLIVFFVNTGHGQGYIPFPISNAHWGITWSTNDCLLSNIPDANYQYAISGDTVIGNLAYSKISRTGLSGYYCPPPLINGNGYIGAIRNDVVSKKVFLVLAGFDSEIIFYDFNITVGDTLEGFFAMNVGSGLCQNLIVGSIDSILIGTSYRKRIEVSAIYCHSYIIEGIGSIRGLFEPMSTMEETGSLNCFAQNGYTLYPDTNTTCNLITGIPENGLASKIFKVFPNPAKNYFQIEFNNEIIGDNLAIDVFDIMGNLVNCDMEKSFHKVDVNTKNLSKGIYHVLIYNNEQIIGKSKFLIQ